MAEEHFPIHAAIVKMNFEFRSHSHALKLIKKSTIESGTHMHRWHWFTRMFTFHYNWNEGNARHICIMHGMKWLLKSFGQLLFSFLSYFYEFFHLSLSAFSSPELDVAERLPGNDNSILLTYTQPHTHTRKLASSTLHNCIAMMARTHIMV